MTKTTKPAAEVLPGETLLGDWGPIGTVVSVFAADRLYPEKRGLTAIYIGRPSGAFEVFYPPDMPVQVM